MDKRWAMNMKAAASMIPDCTEADVKRARDSGCDAWEANGRIDCDELEEWLEENPPPSAEGIPVILIEDALAAKASREMKEEKLAILREKHIPEEITRPVVSRAFYKCKAILTSRPQAAALKIVAKYGGDPIGIEQIIRELINEALGELSKCKYASEENNETNPA